MHDTAVVVLGPELGHGAFAVHVKVVLPSSLNVLVVNADIFIPVVGGLHVVETEGMEHFMFNDADSVAGPAAGVLVVDLLPSTLGEQVIWLPIYLYSSRPLLTYDHSDIGVATSVLHGEVHVVRLCGSLHESDAADFFVNVHGLLDRGSDTGSLKTKLR